MGIIFYPLIGLRSDSFYHILWFFIILVLFNIVIGSFCLIIGAFISNVAIANLFALFFILFSMLFGGFLVILLIY
jgi:hypothetical protein